VEGLLKSRLNDVGEIKNMKTRIWGLGLLLTIAGNVSAMPFVLDFEGLDDGEAIENFYNGGTSENGNSGTNFGVTFATDTLALIDEDAGGFGNFGGEPSPDTAMFFLTGTSSIMNVAAGFDTGFSFFYSAIFNPGSLNVYDGLNGTGSILASLDMPLTTFAGAPDPNGAFSPFVALGVGFAGTAKSVSFAGVQNQIAFDDVTFGAASVVPLPPAVWLFGSGLLGLVGMARRKIG